MGITQVPPGVLSSCPLLLICGKPHQALHVQVQPDLQRVSFSTQALLSMPRRMSMDGLLRLVAGFHPVSSSTVGSDN